ncbi:MAG TPA: class I SAM-dependent methyltransferase [Dermatophilaceae bacterium]|nr:class I SAM-dependent methyltransferase [Dermatophilaceae bacterium]
MDASAWDERYAGADLVWSATPNAVVADLLGVLPPGRVLDVAAGEGRNAIWLASRGWDVLATDFSAVAVERMRQLAGAALGPHAARLTCAVADATRPPPGAGTAYDVVLFCFLQLPVEPWRAALAAGVGACRPGGRVVVVLHARANLDGGYGGPRDPAVLHDPEDVRTAAAELPVEVEVCELRRRSVETPDGRREALDTVAVLRRSLPAGRP